MYIHEKPQTCRYCGHAVIWKTPEFGCKYVGWWEHRRENYEEDARAATCAVKGCNCNWPEPKLKGKTVNERHLKEVDKLLEDDAVKFNLDILGGLKR